MQYSETKNVEQLSADKLHYANSYAKQHHVPVADVLETIAMVERQKMMTRTLITQKKKA